MKSQRLHITAAALLGISILYMHLSRDQQHVERVQPTAFENPASDPARMKPAKPVVTVPTTFERGLPPTAEELWQKPSLMPAMAQFQKWADDYRARPAPEKIEAGIKAATERRAELRRLIRSDPEQALAVAVPESVRRILPHEICSLLEEKIDARGDLLVTAVTYLDGVLPEGQHAVTTQARLRNGRKFDAFTYGVRTDTPTRLDVPLHGLALDGDFAVSEWPGRVLEPIELADARAKAGMEPVCEVSEVPTASTGTETALLMAEEVQFYCGPAHAGSELSAAAYQEAASGGPGTADSSNLSLAPVGWTTGSHRLMAVRVNFKAAASTGTNYHQLTLTDCIDIVNRISETFTAWSYGRLTMEPMGSTTFGSWVGPTIVLSKAAKDYKGDQMGDIWDEVWEKLEAQGYRKSDYSYLLVLAGNAPFVDQSSPEDNPKTVTWGGLARIGQGLSMVRMANAAWTTEERVASNVSVAIHEIGHNFGLAHASNVTLVPDEIMPFKFSEYGDVYDRMGSGGREFNARFKHWLRWLDNASLPVITQPGIYRLREHDLEENAGVRGLQIRHSSSGDASLFIEYRTSGIQPVSNPYIGWNDPLLAFGAQLRLGTTHKPKTFLLDTTPGTPNTDVWGAGNYDSPLLPGRTFSIDGKIFVTNLAADPEAGTMDVQVRYGPFSNNAPPTGSISTVSPTAGLGERVVLTADATDPDDTDLAYFWRINRFDADWRQIATFPNARSIIVEFTEIGGWQLQCIVSDKRGGTAVLTHSISVVANDPPVISSITDKVMDEDGYLYVPFVITDPNGGVLHPTAISSNPDLVSSLGLQITGTGANRTLGIFPKQNCHGTTVITVRVYDGEAFATEDFLLTVKPTTPGMPLITPLSGDWRYRAGSLPPVGDWMTPAYDDSTWSVGNASFIHPMPQFLPLGMTVLPAVSGRVTCYFRRTFTMPVVIDASPIIRLRCDDGAVVYVNGVEVGRHNMPSGPVYPTTSALSSVEGALEHLWHVIPVDPGLLYRGGMNLIAVEVHDSNGVRNGVNGDVDFDLEFSLSQAPVLSSIPDQVVNEDEQAGPYSFTATDAETGGSPLTFTVSSSDEELVSAAQATITPGKAGTHSLTLTPQPDATGSVIITVKASDGYAATWRSFTLTILPVQDAPRITPILGSSALVGSPPQLVRVEVSDPDSDLSALKIDANTGDANLISNIQVFPGTNAGTRWLQLTPVPGALGTATITVTASDESQSTSESFTFRLVHAEAPGSSDITLIRAGALWRYLTSGLPLKDNQPVDFTTPSFDDKDWTIRSAEFYTRKNGSSTISVIPYRITTYFRTTFEVGSPASISLLKLRLKRDDGAVVYLNGTRILLSNMPDLVEPGTLALTDIDRDDEELWHTHEFPAGLLVPGTNIVAVELHQSVKPTNDIEADLVFDLELTATPAAANEPVSPPYGLLIPPGDSWAYWDGSVSGATPAWRDPAADDSSWARGAAPLGYGHGSEVTVVNRYNGVFTNKSVLFRKYFDVNDPHAYSTLHLFMQRDDGAVVYLNGVRVVSDNASHGSHPYEPDPHPGDGAIRAVPPPNGHTTWQHYSIDPSRLVIGRNFIAVSVHQSSLGESTLFFDLQLGGELQPAPPAALDLAGGAVKLNWSAAYAGWQLQKSTNLVNWFPAAIQPVIEGSNLKFSEPLSGERCFYRLVAP
jgi:hypothetical protein